MPPASGTPSGVHPLPAPFPGFHPWKISIEPSGLSEMSGYLMNLVLLASERGIGLDPAAGTEGQPGLLDELEALRARRLRHP